MAKYNALDFVGKTAEEITVMLGEVRAEVKQSTEEGLRVSPKGAISLYGLGRFPVTLYGEQWLKLLDKRDLILNFIVANAGKLAVKKVKGEQQQGEGETQSDSAVA